VTSLNRIRTFFDLPNDSAFCSKPPRAAIFGVASSVASAKDGAENGAYFLRNLSKAYAWQAAETSVVDLRRRNITLESMVDCGDVSGTTHEVLSAQIKAAVEGLAAETVPVFVGGDHSVTYSALQAISIRRELPQIVVCFDHHLDLQYWGNVRDPLFNTNVMSHAADLLGPGRIFHVGVNPMQAIPKERRSQFLKDLSWIGRQFPLGSAELLSGDGILDAIDDDADVYLSVDVDVLGRSEMVATGYPSDYGLPLERLLDLIERIAARHRIAGCDLVEFAADRNDRSAATLADAGRATRILLTLLLAIAAQPAGSSGAAQALDATLLPEGISA